MFLSSLQMWFVMDLEIICHHFQLGQRDRGQHGATFMLGGRREIVFYFDTQVVELFFFFFYRKLNPYQHLDCC